MHACSNDFPAETPGGSVILSVVILAGDYILLVVTPGGDVILYNIISSVILPV